MNPLFYKNEKIESINTKIAYLVSWLKTYDVKLRQIIALFFQNNINFILAYEACKICSLVPLILRRSTDINQLKSLGVSYLFTYDKSYQLIHLQNYSPEISNNISIICQTSGTTGMPKYVPWTYDGIDYQSKVTFDAMQYDSGDILMTTLPLTSAYGLSLVHLWERYPLSLAISDAYYPNEILKIVDNLKVSSFDSVPQIYYGLIRKIKKSLNHVKLWCCGGDYLPLDLSQTWLETTHKPLLDGYGLTEAGPNIALNSPTHYQIGSVGKILHGTSVKLSATNELLVSSPSCAQYYWPNKASILLENTWLPTNDICFLDKNGFLYIKGRVNNKIVINGITLYAEEIESILSSYFLISIIATRIKTHSGDKLGLLLKNSSRKKLDENQIRSACRVLLPGKIIPKLIRWLSALPLSATGKIDRQKAEFIANCKLEESL